MERKNVPAIGTSEAMRFSAQNISVLEHSIWGRITQMGKRKGANLSAQSSRVVVADDYRNVRMCNIGKLCNEVAYML